MSSDFLDRGRRHEEERFVARERKSVEKFPGGIMSLHGGGLLSK
jgi:hypothetical protein